MHIDTFEEQARRILEGHRPEVDTDSIWENIEPRLPKKKRRRGIFFLFGALGLGWALFFCLNGQGVRNLVPSLAHTGYQVHSVSDEPPTPRSIPAALKRENSTMHTRTQTNTVPPMAQQKALNAATHAFMGSPAEKLIVSTPTHPTSATPPSATAFAIERNDTQTNSWMNPAFKASSKGPISNTYNNPPLFTPHPSRFPFNASLFTPTSDTVPPMPSILGWPLPVSTSSPTVDSTQAEKKVVKIASKDTLHQAAKTPPHKKKKRRKSPWTEELSFQAGPELALKQLRERAHISAPSGHLSNREESERSLESFTIGWFYSAAKRSGLVLKTGLNYRQSTERFRLAYTKKGTESTLGVVSVTVDDAGNILEQNFGSKKITTTFLYSNTAYNRYRYLNLPIGAGYRQTNKKSRWELAGGVDFNLFFRARGTIYTSDNVPTALKYGTIAYDRVFRTHIGTGLWATYCFDRRLNDHLRWQISVSVQAPLRPVTSPEYALTQRYFHVGLQGGVVYQVKKAAKGKTRI